MNKKSDFESITIVLCSLILIPNLALAKQKPDGYWATRIVDKTKYVDDFYEQDKYGREKINIFLGDKQIANIDNGELYFNVDNHLGSTSLVTNQDSNIVETNDYGDFGKLTFSDSEIRNNDKFLGQPLDSETNLSYLQNRYYDSYLARFMSIDPLLIFQPNMFLSDPQQLNGYSYARNNPIAFLDKNGLKVSEFQPYYSSNGFYDFGQDYGTYRGLDVISAGKKSGDSDHPYQCVDLFQRFTDNEYGTRIGGLGKAMNYGQQDLLDSKSAHSGEFIAYENGGTVIPQENDIITWSHSNGVGHIGVIIEVSFDENSDSGYVYSMEQNYSGYQPIYTQSFSRSYDNNGQAIYTVEDRGNYRVRSWVRHSNQQNIPYSNILYTPATGNYIEN